MADFSPAPSAIASRLDLKPEYLEKFKSLYNTYSDPGALRHSVARNNTSRDDNDAVVGRLYLCNYYKNIGNTFFKRDDYSAAIGQYILAMRSIVGADVELPSTEGIPLWYIDCDWREYMDLALCCNNIALCYLKIEPRQVEKVEPVD